MHRDIESNTQITRAGLKYLKTWTLNDLEDSEEYIEIKKRKSLSRSRKMTYLWNIVSSFDRGTDSAVLSGFSYN